MQEQSDAQLLRDYAERGCEPAFREIVTRHTDLVYSAAVRCVNSSDLACDIAQSVFTDLSRKARPLADKLANNASLVGWLYRSTRFAALNQLRDDRRRLAHERQAMEQLLSNSETAPDWDRIRPVLDEAMDNLNDEDRDALLLRYFEKHDFRAVGRALGVSDDAAQKRVSRAVERLREFFTKRGVTAGASGLAVIIAANAVQAAPVGLTATISAAVLAGTAVHTSTLIAATKTIAMTTLQKTLITATIAAAVGMGIYEARQASTLKNQVQTLQQQQMPLAEQLTQLRADNKNLSNEVVRARDSQALSKAHLNELLKLRGKAGLAQSDSRELARLKTAQVQRTGNAPDALTNAMAMGMEIAKKGKMKDAQARLARMKKTLNLTDDQAQAISDIMQKHIQYQTQMNLDMFSGKLTPEQMQGMAQDEINQEAKIKALFTPEQLAAYPEFQHAENLVVADKSARTDAGQIADEFNLTRDQQEQIRAAFCGFYLNEPGKRLEEEAVSAGQKSGNFADSLNQAIEWQKSQLEKRLKILESVLTPEQINSYREEQLKEINLSAEAAKTFMPHFFPQKTIGTAN